MKRINFGIRIGALLALAGVALGLSAPAASAAEIRIATQPIPHYAPIFVAKQKKWLDEELAKAGAPVIRWTSFAAGPPINESFAAGQQDIGFLGDTPALIGKSAGIDTRVVGITARGPKSLAVVVGANSPIKTPAQLKGKKVAVTKGSYAQHLLALVLEQGGLSFSDIELINLTNGDIPNAIVSGTIDAGAIWEPVITKFEAQKAIRVLADGTGIKSGVLVIIAAADFLKKNPQQANALLRAYQRGADYIKSNPKEAARLIASDVNLPADLLEQVFAKFDYTPAIRDDDAQEIRRSEAYLHKVGLTRAAVDVDRLLERRIGAQAGLR
jgi:sulfonate transport system substrate-binding protein